jgi:hypothetical protein
MDRQSGPDGIRTSAIKIKTKLVYNDRVNAENEDRTDWRYVMLSQPGKLTVLLHWDQGESKLELDVFDVMGVRIQQGRVWGSGGLRAVVAVEEPGPYYIRVRAAGCDDKSHYSIRTLFKPEKSGAPPVCHGCKVEDRKCLGDSSYIICEKVGPGCTQWTKNFPCKPGLTCKDGICDPCAVPCVEGTQRCSGAKAYVTCARAPGAPCPTWSQPVSCPRKHRCKEGRCVRSGRRPVAKVKPPPKPPPPKPAAPFQRCKVISIYRYRGERTLHLECPESAKVRPGQTGNVMEGNTQRALPGGEIKVTRVSGRYAIATTSLQDLGLNRWVRLRTR